MVNEHFEINASNAVAEQKRHFDITPDGLIQWKRDIAGVALITQTFDSGGTQTASDTRYLVKDHLGTLSLILDNTGNVEEEYYFDAWGKRRTILLAQNINIFNKPTTTRGYTGHEMLDEVGLVHMNGRIYDQTLSRFVQADPIIQDPFKTESLNRYSYVWNNPLNATDPSGFTACENTPSQSTCQKAEANRAAERKPKEGGGGSDKVTTGADTCSSGKCTNYSSKDGIVVSINKSDTKAFEKEMSKEIARGKEDMKNGTSYASMGSSAGNTNTATGGQRNVSAAEQNSNPGNGDGNSAVAAAQGMSGERQGVFEDTAENWFAEGDHKYRRLSGAVCSESKEGCTYEKVVDALNMKGVHPNQVKEFVPGEEYIGDVNIPGPFRKDHVKSTAIYNRDGVQVGVRNETMSDHALHKGEVDRIVVKIYGNFHIYTEGGGRGPYGKLNIWFDDAVWSGVDKKVIDNFR